MTQPSNLSSPKIRLTQQNFLKTGLITPKSNQQLNIPIILKFGSIKQHHRQTMYNIQRNYQITNRQQLLTTNRGFLQKMKQDAKNLITLQQNHFNLLIPGPHNINKFIDKFRISLQSTQNKKTFYSSVDQCKLDTESYDQLKFQIINKIKVKKCQKSNSRNSSKQWVNSKLGSPKAISFQKDKQNYCNAYTSSKIKQKNQRHIRYRSHSDSHKAKRYTQTSVAQFMQQKQSNISLGLSKRFELYRKQNQNIRQEMKTNHTEPDNIQLKQIGWHFRNIQLDGKKQDKIFINK